MSFDGPAANTNSAPGGAAVSIRGSVTLDTSVKLFGPSSGKIASGGNFYSTSTLSLPGEYTVEMFFRPTSSVNGTIIDMRASDSESSEAPALTYIAGGTMSVWINGATRITAAGPYGLNVWHHAVLQRRAGQIQLFMNGQSIGTYASAASLTGKYICCGTTIQGTNNPFVGNIEEFRATLGTGRYSGNFTPRDRPFPRR